jgi:acyl-CoA synthetase (AMP-forming)/AMP-acid ligase II
MSPQPSVDHAVSLRRLARPGARRQLLWAARDFAVIEVCATVAFLVSKPLGLAIAILGALMLGLFALAVSTSGARLQKIIRQPSQIQSVIIAETTNRAGLARAWVTQTGGRSITLAFLADDVDVVVEAFRRTNVGDRLNRFPNETAARAEVTKLRKDSTG